MQKHTRSYLAADGRGKNVPRAKAGVKLWKPLLAVSVLCHYLNRPKLEQERDAQKFFLSLNFLLISLYPAVSKSLSKKPCTSNWEHKLWKSNIGTVCYTKLVGLEGKKRYKDTGSFSVILHLIFSNTLFFFCCCSSCLVEDSVWVTSKTQINTK